MNSTPSGPSILVVRHVACETLGTIERPLAAESTRHLPKLDDAGRTVFDGWTRLVAET